MASLEEALAGLRAQDGVRHLLLLGHDGLLIRHLGERGDVDEETVAAMAPGVAAACRSLAHASGAGDFASAVLEFGAGVGILVVLSPELLLLLLLRPGVGFAPLLRQVRQQRGLLAGLL
jgi:predicted regulator of Ras-like GTPase activity (Roadblock/LC7/MglB family)